MRVDQVNKLLRKKWETELERWCACHDKSFRISTSCVGDAMSRRRSRKATYIFEDQKIPFAICDLHEKMWPMHHKKCKRKIKITSGLLLALKLTGPFNSNEDLREFLKQYKRKNK